MGGESVRNRRLAAWLVARRPRIDRALASSLGERAPSAGSVEAEALRRLRSFASTALLHGGLSDPPVDGLRVDGPTVDGLVSAWLEAASAEAGPDADAVRALLEPVGERFRVALRGGEVSRRARGAPRRSSRRAVAAAIDRVADAFLAIDIATGRIEDANPAAGALLGQARDRLVGASALDHVPRELHDLWWTHLEAVSEGADERRFRTRLLDERGGTIGVEASVTRFATRRRTLALVMARPAP